LCSELTTSEHKIILLAGWRLVKRWSTPYHGSMKRKNVDVDLNIPIGAAVRAWREARKLSVTELAQHAGRPVTKSYLSELENGKIQNPGALHVNRIASTLGIPVLYLVARWLPDQVAEVSEGAVAGNIDKTLPRARRGFGFRAPDLSELHTVDRVEQLKEVLAEIAEITHRIEDIRRVVEEIVRSEERVR
jgi:transcriptional regulator with XRE-family HTH domain